MVQSAHESWSLKRRKCPQRVFADDHIFATLTNDHMDMSMFRLQHIKDEKCFNRLVILCLDDVTFSKCEAAGFKHCVKIYQKTPRILCKVIGRSCKPKMALAPAKLTVFTLDSDILFFQVPDWSTKTSRSRAPLSVGIC